MSEFTAEHIAERFAALTAEVARLNGLDATQAATIRSLEAENAGLLSRARLAERQLAEKTDPVTLAEMYRERYENARLQSAYTQARTDYTVACAQLRERDAEVARLRALWRDVLEYWNGSQNERAMVDALDHVEQIATEALADQPAPECAWIDCPHKAPHMHGGTVTYHPVPAPDARDAVETAIDKSKRRDTRW